MIKQNNMTILLLIISFTINANPNSVININPHYDKNYNLVTPDKILLVEAIKAYQAGFNESALTKFRQSAAFGNSNAQKYIGLMYIKSLGVKQNWAKGYAWIKLAALDGTKEHIDLMHNIYKNLKPDEIKQANIEYQKISEDYDLSATLKRRDRWARKQKLKRVGSRTGSQTTNVQSQGLNGINLDPDRTSKLDQMKAFVDDYQFGVVTSGEIIPKEESGN